MKVAIVHDDLVQWGGAERVLEGICEIFPDAPVYTSVFDKNNSILEKKFGSREIITSFLQKIPGWRKIYKPLLPFYPIAFEQFNFDDFDLVISHTTRFAKAILTKPHTKHICYCHTPPRFLWNFPTKENLKVAELFFSFQRIYDQISSRRVDSFLAGSKNAQKRIKKVYGRESEVVYPFIDLERFKNIETFDGGYFLVISRQNSYKKIDLAVGAFRSLGLRLKIIGVTKEDDNLIEFLGKLSDEMVVRVLAGCKALIIPGVEDFGLVSIEAQALGKPVLAFKSGGSLETVIHGKTGILFDTQSSEAIKQSVTELESIMIDPILCRENAKKFSKDLFINNFKEKVAFLG